MSKQSIPESGIYDARELGVPKMLILGFQHMFAMFGATVLVPALTGLSVSATLLFAGLGTLLFHLLAKGKVPAFLGSSFAFIGGYAAVAPMLPDAAGEATIPNLELLPYACFGVALAVFSTWSCRRSSRSSASGRSCASSRPLSPAPSSSASASP